MELRRDFIWMLGSKVIAMAAAFAAAAMINRSLGPSGRGIYAEIQTWIGLFAVVFGMSMDTAIYHFSNKALYGADDQSRFITAFSLSLIYALLASGALTLFVVLWPEQVSSETFNYVFLLDVLLISTMLLANLTIFLQAMGEIGYSAIIAVAQAVTNLLVIGYVYMMDLLTIKTVLMSLLVMQGIAFLMLFAKFAKSNLFNGGFSMNLAKGMIAAGLKQHIATIATFVYTKINQLMVFRYGGESESGIFAVSLSAAFYFMFIPMTFQTVLYPRVIHAADDYEITIRSLRWGFYLWGIMSGLMILFAKPILLLYAGKDFLPAISTFRILMLAAWLLALSSLVAPYCTKHGAFYAMSFSAIGLGVLSLLLNRLLIPNLLGIGAALATCLTTLVGFCLVLILLGFLSKRNPLEFVKVMWSL